jgi:RimJ/RimL family protein N-acetyltransferase
MLKIVPYQPWHLDSFDIDDKTQQAIACLGEENLVDYVNRYIQGEMAFTGFEGGEVFAVAGIIKIRHGLGEAFVFLANKYFDGGMPLKYKVNLARSVKQYLRIIAKNAGFWRIQATVDASNDQACRFAEFLGFRYEGKMKCYGSNKADYIMYAVCLEG